ncbi:MAG TPA: TonB-dependent receptor [Steroidobacteraceae bacterium]|nr:TonB-dependent receptor [Steroidobacteraceae bacterium]
MTTRAAIRGLLLVGVTWIVSGLAAAEVATSDTEVEEIVVTAQKRPELIQNVSAQVDVLTAQSLQALQIRQTPEIAATVPNLTVARNDTYTNSTIVLRGITQANNSDVPVAIIVDGVPQDDSKQFNTHLFDIAQIEVLKGPQGALYGRNAEAGAIIITTAAPTNEFRGFADVSYGKGAAVEASTGISGALVTDRVLYRLAGNYSRSDGLIFNPFLNNHSDYVDYDRSIRGSLRFLLSDQLRLDLIAQIGGFKAGTTYFAPVFSADPNDIRDPQGNFPGVDTGHEQFYSAKLEADLGFATFTSVSGYARIEEHQISDVDFTNPVASPTVFQVGDNQPSGNRIWSQDLRLVGPGSGVLRWLASADYLNSSQLLSTNIFVDTGHPASDPFDPALLLVSSSATNKRSDYGVSAQLDYDIVERLTLTAGLRYDDDRRTQINLNNGQEREASFNAVQPKVTATYRFSPVLLTYISYGVGFRSGGFNQPNFSIPVFPEEKLINVEAGVKSQWFERRLTVNAAAFTGKVENYQYSYIDFATASPVTGSVDRVRLSGGELETRFSPGGGLNLFFNTGVAVPRITSLPLFPQFVGNQTPRATDVTLQGGMDYTVPLAGNLAFFVGSNVQFDSRTYWYIDNLDVQKPKTCLNANLGIRSGPYSVTVWGKNLLDTRSYDTYDPNQATGLGRDVGYPNKPLSFGVELAARF